MKVKRKQRGPSPERLALPLPLGEALTRLFSTPKGTRKQMNPRRYGKRKKKGPQ